MLRLVNCSTCQSGKLEQNSELYVDVENGIFVDFQTYSQAQTHEVVDLKGQIVAPGYIDIQNNGVYGVNFSLLKTDATEIQRSIFEARYRDVMAKYLRTGVTAMCPTMTSTKSEIYHHMVPIFHKSRNSYCTDSLGAHLEGPFINIQKRGCHPKSAIAANNKSSKLESVYGSLNLKRNVAIVTVAPEIPGVMDQIPELVKDGVVVSIGHTLLDSESSFRAISKGATMITHLYNAMPQPHHRKTGLVGTICDPRHKSPYFGLICDGIHVDPAMCVIAYRANPSKCVLVTDAMHLFGLPDGEYKWENLAIKKKNNRLVLKGTETLAGAATDLAKCVRNLMEWTDISLPEAVRTVSENAANALGIRSKGNLIPGSDADMVILNVKGEVLDVYKLGRRVESLNRNSVL